MARFLRWLLGLDNVSELMQFGDDARTLRRRLEPRIQDLELDVTRLELRFDRLRGTVTGAMGGRPTRAERDARDEDTELDDGDVDDEDDVEQRVLDMIQKRRRDA